MKMASSAIYRYGNKSNLTAKWCDEILQSDEDDDESVEKGGLFSRGWGKGVVDYIS
jgi:hypothetical protein